MSTTYRCTVGELSAVAHAVGYTVAKVLVTDDNKLTRDILRAIMELASLSVEEADGGQACLDAVTADPPDIIILDLRMPKMDGWEAARILKADPATRDIPIVALTADTRPESMEAALTAGCDRYLTKPINRDKLLQMIYGILTESRP